jgi:hypothetical protein
VSGARIAKEGRRRPWSMRLTNALTKPSFQQCLPVAPAYHVGSSPNRLPRRVRLLLRYAVSRALSSAVERGARQISRPVKGFTSSK